MAHKVKTTRARVKRRDDFLDCERLSGYGWRCVCDCGERSPVFGGYAAARAWATGHVKMSQERHAAR